MEKRGVSVSEITAIKGNPNMRNYNISLTRLGSFDDDVNVFPHRGVIVESH